MTAVLRAARLLAATILGAAAVGLAALLAPMASPAAADPIDACNTESGVIVIVDFGAFGGSIQRGCAAAPASGLQALQSSFSIQGTARWGLRFVCRINGSPSADLQPCLDTPPGDAYWSYWSAPRGQSTWSYSGTGAASARPGGGSVDGWVFGDGANPPAASPDAVRAMNPPPAPEQPSTQAAPVDPTPQPPATAPESSAPPAATTRANAPPTSGTAPPPDTSTPSADAESTPATQDAATPTESAAVSAGDSTSTPAVVNVSSPASATNESGSPVPTIIAVLVVVAIGIGAGVVGLRRRGRSASP